LLLLLNNFEGAQHAHSLSVEHLPSRLSIFPVAAVRAIVIGYAEGKIELPKVSRDTAKDKIRNAPAFACGSNGSETTSYRDKPRALRLAASKKHAGSRPRRDCAPFRDTCRD
jgi:hypothetical protein